MTEPIKAFISSPSLVVMDFTVELFELRRNDHNGCRCASNNAFGHAAHEQSIESRSAMTSDNDERWLDFGGKPFDLGNRRAFGRLGGNGNATCDAILSVSNECHTFGL